MVFPEPPVPVYSLIPQPSSLILKFSVVGPTFEMVFPLMMLFVNDPVAAPWMSIPLPASMFLIVLPVTRNWLPPLMKMPAWTSVMMLSETTVPSPAARSVTPSLRRFQQSQYDRAPHRPSVITLSLIRPTEP